MRAFAEDRTVAAAFGIDHRRLGWLLGGLSGASAAVAGMVFILGNFVEPATAYEWFGIVFAVVILGGLGNLLGTLLAGITVGAMSGLVALIWSQAVAPIALFLAIILALVLRPQGVFTRGRHRMSARDLVATVPRRLAILVGAMVLIGVLGQFNESIGLAPYNIVVLYTVLFWISQATSWNLLSGYAGYFSFGQGAYLGIGAYTMAVMTGRHNVDYLISIPVGGLLAGVLALLVGAVAFRLRSLRGEIFALLTLAVPFILAAIARINSEIDGGQGTTLRTPPLPDWIGDFQHLMFLLNLVVATLAVGVALAVHGSRFGRGLAAVHDAEDAAEVLGVPTFRYKMIAIVLGAVLGGMSGALLAMSTGYVVVESIFTLSIPLFVILICVLGGRRHWLGPVIGAVFLVVLQDRLVVGGLGSWRDIILGALLAGLVVLAPEGLYGRLRAQPWLALASFLVVCVGLLLTGYYADLDAVLYGMLAAAMVATVGDWWRRRQARFRTAPSTSDEPRGRAGAGPVVPAQAVPRRRPGCAGRHRHARTRSDRCTAWETGCWSRCAGSPVTSVAYGRSITSRWRSGRARWSDWSGRTVRARRRW